MAQWLRELDEGNSRRQGRNALAQLARVTLSLDGNTLPESKAQTRYTESDSLELLLLRDLRHSAVDKVSHLTLLNGEQVCLPWQRIALSKPQWRQLTATLMRQIVPVHARDAPAALSKDTLKRFGFHHCFYLGRDDWGEDESVLRLALVDEAGALQGVEGASVHEKHSLSYRDDLGFRVCKN